MSFLEKIQEHKKTIILVAVFLAIIILSIIFIFPSERVVEEEIVFTPVPATEEDLRLMVAQMTNLTDLVNKLNTEFSYRERDDKTVRLPKEFLTYRGGNKLDFAVFSAFVLNEHQLGEIALIRYRYLMNEDEGQKNIETGIVFRGEAMPPQYLRFGSEGVFAIPYGWSYQDLFQVEEERTGKTIIDYQAFLLWPPIPNEENLWPEEWYQR